MVPVMELKDPNISDVGIRYIVDSVYNAGKSTYGSDAAACRFLADTNFTSCSGGRVLRCRNYAEEKYGVSPVMTLIIGKGHYKGNLSELKKAKDMGIDVIAMHHDLISEKYSQYCRDNGMALRSWVFDSKASSDEALYRQVFQRQYSTDMFVTNGKIFR